MWRKVVKLECSIWSKFIFTKSILTSYILMQLERNIGTNWSVNKLIVPFHFRNFSRNLWNFIILYNCYTLIYYLSDFLEKSFEMKYKIHTTTYARKNIIVDPIFLKNALDPNPFSSKYGLSPLSSTSECFPSNFWRA